MSYFINKQGNPCPIVSVIVPIYNVEKYLDRCIRSLSNQSLKDIEIILINDGSTDSSAEICSLHAKEDHRIQVIHMKNEGVSAARNAGIEIAKGEYIGFIDGDDWAELNMFEDLVKNITDNNSDLVVCGYKNVFDNGEITHMKINNDIIDIEKMGLSKYLLEYFVRFKHAYCVWNKLYKRELIKKHNIRFESTKDIYGEDILFNLYYLSHAKIISSTSLELINYLQRDNSLSRFPENVLCRITELVNRYICYAKENNVDNIGTTVFCSQIITSLSHLRKSDNPDYITQCLKGLDKSETFRSYSLKILLNKSCIDFLISQKFNLKSIFFFKFTLLMLIFGQHSFIVQKLIKY